jgi:predicted nucleotidyltransferase
MIELDDIRNGIAVVAPIYNVRSVHLFGSYANGNATDKSDVDLLVEYDQQDKSYLTILGFKEHLTSVLGLDVDILEYPLDEQKLFYKSFRLGEVIKVYG